MKFNSIQILRAIASLSVVLFHVPGYMMIVGGAKSSVFGIFSGIFGYGAILFFAISGFIMAHLIDTGYHNFLARRFLRIYPTYILVVMIIIIVKIIAFETITQPDLFKSLTLLPFGVIPYPLSVEWTLVYEVFFYFVCSFFTIGNLKKVFPHFLFIWLGIIIIASLKFNLVVEIVPTYKTIFFQIFNMFFITGALSYHLYKWIPVLSNKVSYILLGSVVAILALWLKLREFISWFAVYEYYVFALCCVALLISSLSIKINVNKTIYNIFIKLGDYSYAIYLVHASVLSIIFTIYLKNVGGLNSKIALVAFATCIFLGWWIGKIDVFIHKSTKNFFANKKSPASD